MKYWLESGEHISLANRTIPTADLRVFYESRNFEPLWVNKRRVNKDARNAMRILMRADEHGLNSANYHIPTRGLLKQSLPFWKDGHVANLAGIELLLSEALMRYMHDIRFGVTPAKGRFSQEFREEKESPAELLAALAQTDDVENYLRMLEPRSADYTGMRQALAVYRAIAQAGGWPKFPPGPKIIPRKNDARLNRLRQILTMTGDLPQDTQPARKNYYDDVLKEAVIRFQERHGLESDGTIGKKTMDALNVSVEKRIEQISASMERMRWLPHQLGERHLVVNLPGYQLIAYDRGQEAFSSRVIVGDKKHHTPVFSNSITQVVLNPTWHVPQRIAAKELLPKIKKDPEYLTRGGYRLIEREDAEEIDPELVNWEMVDEENFNFALKQSPGDGNALGKIKFSLPNNNSIYLHSTSQPKLFAKAERALSHGCIRVEKPRELAHFLLTEEGWDADEIDSAYAASEPRTVDVSPLPVHAVYWTSWVDGDGSVHFAEDIYGQDAPLIAALNQSDTNSEIKFATNVE